MEPHDTLPELEKMRLGVAYKFPVKVRDFTVQLRPLTISETIQVHANVIDHLKSVPDAANNAVNESSSIAKESLKFASQSDYGTGDYKLTDAVMNRWTPAELDYVFKQYVAGTDICSPQLEEIGTDGLEQLVEELKKKAKGEQLLLLTEQSFLVLANLARYLLTKGD